MALRKTAAVLALLSCLVAGEALAGKRASVPVLLNGTLNLNTATVKELDQLPGIGEMAARRVVEYRTRTPFTRVEDLVKVKGFGKKRFDRLKTHLSVAGPSTLKVSRGVAAQGRSAPAR